MKRLRECQSDKYENYLMPLFWQHGETHEEILRGICAIEKCGIREFCVESRVYEDFCGEKWWRDFSFILEEAKKRGMRVWLLDDKRFPTGYANGALKDHPECRKKHLRLEYVDVAGPQKECALLTCGLDADEHISAAVAYERSGKDEELCGDGILLSAQNENLSDGLLFCNLPDGIWRVFFLIETRRTPQDFREHIDLLNPASCALQIEAVYAPQYAHFKEYFGNTFAGFFSDEPSFGNDSGAYDSILGKKDMLLPWSDALLPLLSNKMNLPQNETKCLLPLLWAEHPENKHFIRYAYMDAVSELYRQNFSLLLGNWCREHGVEYIGHIIEDMNAHMRLGYGAGHYFRAMDGQDMAGCDLVLNQMIPGIRDMTHTAFVFENRADPTFYSYTLGKLASSAAHLDEKKKDRAFCEIFGAFGWAEGVPTMKRLADSMLAGGINRFMPHAFNEKYPDYDCPPHFSDRKEYFEFPFFQKLCRYMQRMCHILSGGTYETDIAVLYNAEAEWCGGKYELFQNVAKELLQNQIDFDFVPSDVLKKSTFTDGKIRFGNRNYRALVISYSEVLPEELLKILSTAGQNGVAVFMCGALPKRTAEKSEFPFEMLSDKDFCIVETDTLAVKMREKGFYDVRLLQPQKTLRYCHRKIEEKDVYFFVNEDIRNRLETEILLPHGGEYVRYDAWNNTLLYGKTTENVLSLSLLPSEACVIVFEEHGKKAETEKEYRIEPLLSTFKIEIWDEKNRRYEFFDRTDTLYSLARRLPQYGGKIRYTFEIGFSADPPAKLELGEVGETACLMVNGKECGDSVSYPYRFDTKGKFCVGENTVAVEVIPNLAYSERDVFSKFSPLPPMGLIGPIRLFFEA